MEKAILFDTSKCVACRACQVACKQWWELPAVATTNRGTYENPSDLAPQTWNKIRFKEIGHNGTVRWLFTRQSCMHCTEAVCVWVCPTYARSYNELGYVVIDQERCIGCARCIAFCPFGVPRIGRYNITPRLSVELGTPRDIAYKCEFCKDRVEDGLTPACAKTCPTGATQFGERADLVELGKIRVDAIKAAYPEARLYGEKELGGLHVIYILTDAPGIHGLPESPQFGTYTKFDEKSYPDWYNKAVADGKLSTFPEGAKPEWYLQSAGEAAGGQLAAFERGQVEGVPATGWKNPAVWTLLGLGVIGAGAALWWTLQRRMTRQKEKKKT